MVLLVSSDERGIMADIFSDEWLKNSIATKRKSLALTSSLEQLYVLILVEGQSLKDKLEQEINELGLNPVFCIDNIEAKRLLNKFGSKVIMVVSSFDLSDPVGRAFRELILENTNDTPFAILTDLNAFEIDNSNNITEAGYDLTPHVYMAKNLPQEIWYSFLRFDVLTRISLLGEEVKLRGAFMQNSENIIQNTEELVLSLDDNPEAETLDTIFGNIHTLKGGSSFLQPKNLERFMHKFEDLINKLRSGDLVMTSEVITAMLKVLDKSKELIEDLGAHFHHEYEEGELAAYFSAFTPTSVLSEEKSSHDNISIRMNLPPESKAEMVVSESIPTNASEAWTSLETSVSPTSVVSEVTSDADKKNQIVEVTVESIPAASLSTITIPMSIDLDIPMDFNPSITLEELVSTIDDPSLDIDKCISSEAMLEEPPQISLEESFDFKQGNNSTQESVILPKQIEFTPDIITEAELELIPEVSATGQINANIGESIAEAGEIIASNAEAEESVNFPLNEKSVVRAVPVDPVVTTTSSLASTSNVVINTPLLSSTNISPMTAASSAPFKKDNASEPSSKGNSSPPPSNNKKKDDKSLKVPISLLDTLMHISGELTVVRNMINKIDRSLKVRYNGDRELERMSSLLEELHKLNGSLQTHILDLRKVPVKEIVAPLNRVVRDLSKHLDKIVTLKVQGAELRIDTAIAEILNNTLIHIVRNSIDHGLESTQERMSNGKPQGGNLYLDAFEENDNVYVRIKDDGRGLQTEKIRNRAIERGLMTEEQARALKEEDVWPLIFAPGFSTADKVTDISGRGIGMSAVKEAVEAIDGEVEISSVIGEGSCITLSMPLPKSVLITRCLFILISGMQLGIPNENVYRIVHLDGETDTAQLSQVEDTYVLSLEDELIPVVQLDQILGTSKVESLDSKVKTIVVFRSSKGAALGVFVNDVLEFEDAVVKPFTDHLKAFDIFFGTTFLGDGSIGLIFRVDGLIETYRAKQFYRFNINFKARENFFQETAG